MSSDYYINAPDELITHLTHLFKLYLGHGYGYIPPVGDMTSSENYRAIAGGFLLLKLVDLVIILLEGDKLDFDCMQFAYQVKSSTAMCTWTATAVVDYFNRGGRPVFAASMDMSKAFDLVSWKHLFQTLQARKIDCLFLRLILQIYINQKGVVWLKLYFIHR